MRKWTGLFLAFAILASAGGGAWAQSPGDSPNPKARAHRPPAAGQGRSVGYETWGGGYRRWNYGNFGTCTNVQLAAGMCPSYYKR